MLEKLRALATPEQIQRENEKLQHLITIANSAAEALAPALTDTRRHFFGDLISAFRPDYGLQVQIIPQPGKPIRVLQGYADRSEGQQYRDYDHTTPFIVDIVNVHVTNAQPTISAFTEYAGDFREEVYSLNPNDLELRVVLPGHRT